jgi:hypothetical protein
MDTITVSAQFPMILGRYDGHSIESITLATKTFISIKFPELKNIQLDFGLTYSTENPDIIIHLIPLNYLIQKEIEAFLNHYIENEFDNIHNQKFSLSAILYVPKTWLSNMIADYYDLFTARLKYLFRNIEIEDIRFVYVLEPHNLLITPIINELQDNYEEKVHIALANTVIAVYNEIELNNNVRKLISSIED